MTGSRVLVALRVQAPTDRTFAAFTGEIGQWWQPNGLFQFTERDGAHLAVGPDPPGRLVEIGAGGERFGVGPVRVWDPPRRVVFGWHQARFDDDQSTEVSVRFDAVDDGTRVTVEHFGWDTIPQEHAARHGFPLATFQQREAEWWQRLLRSLRAHVTDV